MNCSILLHNHNHYKTQRTNFMVGIYESHLMLEQIKEMKAWVFNLRNALDKKKISRE